MTAAETPSGSNSSIQMNLRKAFEILKFTGRLIEICETAAATGRSSLSSSVTTSQWKASYFSNCGVYALRTHDYLMSIEYFELSLAELASVAKQ